MKLIIILNINMDRMDIVDKKQRATDGNYTQFANIIASSLSCLLGRLAVCMVRKWRILDAEQCGVGS
jgi:hypothetical protein